MQLFGQILVNGILLGGLYGLMGLGMGLVWGVLKIVNLAHGALIMMGGYALYFLYTKAGIDPFLGLPLAMLILFAIGYLLQVLLLNLIVRSAQLNTLLLTFGLDVVFVYMAQLLFTADFRTINPPYAGKNVSLLGVTVPYAQLGAFGVAVLLAALLYLVLDRTRTGRAIRATAQNLVAARLYGVNPKRIYAVTFGIGAALAGAAGSLVAVLYSFSPVVGDGFTMKAFVVVVLGGLGSIRGAIVAGIVLGVVENVVSGLLVPGYRDAVSFVLLVLVLVLRPRGIFGNRYLADARI